MDLSKAVKIDFNQLKSNYPLPYEHRPDRTPAIPGIPIDDKNGETFKYYNQCAIRLSIALRKLGIDISNVKNVWNPGGQTFANGNVIGAINLAYFIRNNLLGKPEEFDGTKENVGKLLEGKTGIIFFQRYNENYSENLPESRLYGNTHIDLWDKNHLMAEYREQMLDSKIIWFSNIK